MVASRPVLRDAEGWLCEYNGIPVVRINTLPNSRVPVDKFSIKSCVNLKGCNGSGKSTIPIYMLHAEPTIQVVYLTLSKDDKSPVATYCKTYDTVILGVYLTACGGCDYLGDTQIVKRILSRLWKKDVHIIFEGVIVGDIKTTFYEILTEFNAVHPRNVSFCFMGTKYKECLRRIQRRNGGKPINESMVLAKYRNSATHLRYYLEHGGVTCTVLNTDCTRQEAFERFLELYPQLQPIF